MPVIRILCVGVSSMCRKCSAPNSDLRLHQRWPRRLKLVAATQGASSALCLAGPCMYIRSCDIGSVMTA